jgi:drug/metabolite transporter (DMT)-like permease
MDRILFLIYCAGNTLIYSLLKYTSIQLPEYSTLELISYANILSFLFMLPYFSRNYKKIISKPSLKYSKLSLTVLASMIKVFAVGYVSPRNTAIIGFSLPIFVIFFSFIFLKEYTKNNVRYYLSTLIAFVGVVIFVGYDVQKYNFIYVLLFIHVALRAAVNILLKQLCKDQYMTIFYIKFFYALFGVFMVAKNFNMAIFFNKFIVMIAIVSFIDQISLIKSYEMTSKIALLQTMDYSKIFFTIFWTFIMLGEKTTYNQVYGLIVIFLAIMFSNFKIKGGG